ncbi:hypothetical protein RO561_004820 [Salmonella enterica]|uniref:Uncharacterized protein n=1 Tax=Salmonella muenchen TaxID=596 RepID=A0A5U9P0C4_SALMU|nr:hypothetical protein [Salmonella enterica]EBR0042504.1 hypothetical protein [Salmonella enterica subsp. enterica serovar Oranienburg]EBS3167663.1 hypothetical protein [Salmonella enterica subsp. enterica serovar Muenchen]ECC9287541.1 hypothetical protein [Salmonella enterica subsp. enterica]ECG6339140.1 hypothetical protein [Salmonella enterica subsp. enterica serovar Poona]ECM8963869.1 hypothetical protein [Salmonella enterica subsp. enterica serovar Senftenberg]ECY7785680.1 hypothetical 
MTTIYLAVLVVYVLGFAGMFFYSLKRDVVCGLERNPREAFMLALFWPIVVFILGLHILVENIIFCMRRRGD